MRRSALSRTSWFALWVMQQAGSAIPEGEDVTLSATLDPGLQTVAEAALDNAIAMQGQKLQYRPGGGGGAGCA